MVICSLRRLADGMSEYSNWKEIVWSTRIVEGYEIYNYSSYVVMA